jgi:DNA-binding XRE family transcriptional regulator
MNLKQKHCPEFIGVRRHALNEKEKEKLDVEREKCVIYIDKENGLRHLLRIQK